MLPTFAARSKTELSSLWEDRAPFDSFFDEAFFLNTFATYCPQMKIYKPRNEQDVAPALPVQYIPHSMRSDQMSNTPKDSISHFNTWLASEDADLENGTVLVGLGSTLWDGPDTRSLPPHIRQSFGGLLRLHPTVRRLAATVTYNLAQRFSLPLNPDLPYYPTGYFGTHLHSEVNAANADWSTNGPHSNFSSQASAYISQAQLHNFAVIYTASGNQSELERFKDVSRTSQPAKATSTTNNNRIHVTYKHDLLDGADLDALNALSWDQQALVDYEVLLRCGQFGGFVKSSFSYNIAITRNVLVEREVLSMEPFRHMSSDGSIAFWDHLSVIWGRDAYHEMKIPRGAWP